MNLTQIISPVGIDFVVNRIQTMLSSKLPINGFDSYPRIYKEETERGVVPMLYVGNGEYTDVLFNDNLAGSLYFVSSDKLSQSQNEFNGVDLSMIVQINLSKVYAGISHRADEEAHNDFIRSLNEIPVCEVTELITGIDNVYSEFNRENIRLDDIGKFHVFRINLKVNVNYNKCR